MEQKRAMRIIKDLEDKVSRLEDELRVLKSKQLQVTPNSYPFWHESQNVNTTYKLGMDLHNQQDQYFKKNENIE